MSIKRLLLLVAGILISLFIQTLFSQDSTMIRPVTVDSVNIVKYAGKWYEIAKIPNRFQKQCNKNTTAEYTILPDGNIRVINRCLEEDGTEDSADGIARIVDTKSNAKLEVSFVSIFGFNLFWGDYWIIGLDKDYRYAVVGTPSRKYGWILCRQKSMSEEDFKMAYHILERNGYSPTDFELSLQD